MLSHHFVVELRNVKDGFRWLQYSKDLGYCYSGNEDATKFFSVSSAIHAIKESRDLDFYDAVIYLVENNRMYRIKT